MRPGRIYSAVRSYGRRNIVVVSKGLGHARVSITSDIYTRAPQGWQRQTAAFA